jgi:uncharacterized membrane protein YdcZ (DUF606 family)
MRNNQALRYRLRYGVGQIDDVNQNRAGIPEYGYFAGGENVSQIKVATADRITFSTGTTAAFTAANLSQAREELAGLSDKIEYGYFAGGTTGAVVATADRITFSTGTTAAFTAANLPEARRGLASSSDGSTYGYFAGGVTSVVVATADRITFSTGTTAAFTAANLPSGKMYFAGISDGSTYGYFAGGINTSFVRTNLSDRITFSTGTTAAFTAANLSQAKDSFAGLSDGSTYGYFAGGITNGPVFVNTADRITFSTGTAAAFTAANLSQAKNRLASSSDGSTYGYFAGGQTGSQVKVATADRITFSTGTTAAFTAANLSQARDKLAGLADYAI